jgi:methionyl-tRNA formyltransferase
MKISILCSSREHPVYRRLQAWMKLHQDQHVIELVERCAELNTEGGGILFLISCNEIVPAMVRRRYQASLVIHASDLPQGKGVSPLVWQILEGKNTITVTLLEAEDVVDSGAIWHKTRIQFEGHELCEDIHAALFDAELGLMDFALMNLETIHPVPQTGEASYYRRRTPEDSRLDVHRTIAEQFDLLRVADSARYPAFFDYRGRRYQVILKKVDEDES